MSTLTETRPRPSEEQDETTGRPKWIVERQNIDATRPWAVVATFRTSNRVNKRYATETQAIRRARDLNSGRRTAAAD